MLHHLPPFISILGQLGGVLSPTVPRSSQSTKIQVIHPCHYCGAPFHQFCELQLRGQGLMELIISLYSLM